jgi:hypothetical protein
MSDQIEQKLADNLRRWQASGQPERWCEACQGQWTHADWQLLISALWWSEYWPMEPASIRAILEALSMPFNLRRWQQSGEPWRWVGAHHGAWNHDDWLALLAALRHSEFWPLHPEAVGAVLAQTHALWWNLERWKRSGFPQTWVESRQGMWNHADWLALLDTVRQSEFWPIEPGMVGATLEEYKRRYHNLIRWQFSGHPRRWVEARQGTWDDAEWRSLTAALRESVFWPLDMASVARVLESHQREWWNLRRWRDAGLARRWVEVHGGQWQHDDWLTLLATLRASGYWPIDPAALGQALEEARVEWANLQRWRDSHEPRAWLAVHEDGWRAADLDALAHSLWQSEYWPIDLRAVEALLRELAREQANLQDWQASGSPDKWVALRADGWTHTDWLALTDELRESEFWPLPLDDVGSALMQRRQALKVRRAHLDASIAKDGPAVVRMPMGPGRRAA